MIKKIGVVSYNAGNIHSIVNSLDHIGCETKIIKSIKDINKIDYLVIPGVGSYGHCIDNLKKHKFFDIILNTLKEITKFHLCVYVLVFKFLVMVVRKVLKKMD